MPIKNNQNNSNIKKQKQGSVLADYLQLEQLRLPAVHHLLQVRGEV